MNLIDPKCEEITQKPGLQGLYEQIEMVDRTCYKSKPKYRYYTEICMTGTEQQWEQFLQLRCYESTGKVHPDMKVVADMVKDIIENAE